MNEKEISENNLIYKTYAGSIMYGTNHVDSDIDIKGICIMPQDYYYGLKRFEQTEVKNIVGAIQQDITIYEFSKFIKLAMNCNPNIIEILFSNNSHVLFINDFGKKLLDNRHKFLSKKLYNTFCGYAYSQKRKLLTKEAIGKRVQLIEKYGYDVKFATHLVRLMYEGIELLTECNLTLPGFYNRELLDIRLGKWKLEDVLAKYEQLKLQFDYAYLNSKLPYSCDKAWMNDFLMENLESYWNKF